MDFVNFGDLAREQLGEQAQYASRYIDGRIPGYPNLGHGLRFEGDPADYHDVRIHRDDVEEFVRRWISHRRPMLHPGELLPLDEPADPHGPVFVHKLYALRRP
jgi:hypothetical protein